MDYKRQYQTLHNSNPKLYSGQLSDGQVGEITRLVAKHCPLDLLDYGSGKGYQYLRDRVHEAWGGLLPTCYDPGVHSLSRAPIEGRQFDGIICTDVLEHIDPEDIVDLITHAFSFLRPGKFAYFYICTRESKRLLPDGRGVHLTVQPAYKWEDHFAYYRTKGFEVVTQYG